MSFCLFDMLIIRMLQKWVVVVMFACLNIIL